MRPWRLRRVKAAVARSERLTRSCLANVARIERTASRNRPTLSRYCSVKDFPLNPRIGQPAKVIQRLMNAFA